MLLIMRRQIIFRGYNLKNQKWLYGYYLVNRGQHFICPDGVQNPLASWEDFVVEEESVGEWAGCIDARNKKVYEGDVVLGTEGSVKGMKRLVEWSDFKSGFTTPIWRDMYGKCCYVVIGNIYENKELLEDEE